MLVETEQLTKRYGRFTALDQCTLNVRAGEVLGLLGPNGAGKTTLLRLLLGFLRPTSGHARVAGKDCVRESLAVRHLISYLPGEARLYRPLRGSEVLRFFAYVRPTGSWNRACELAERLELDLTRRVAFMSTGMRQKLALAATLSAETPLVILDEPTANLDPTVRATVIQLVREANAAGRTVIFSSHVLSEVEEVCDRVVILRAGQLVHTQVMAELRHCHRIRAEVAGALPAIPNHLEGQLTIRSPASSEQQPRAVTIETAGEMAPLLGWLGTLPIQAVRIEPIGLRAVYDRFHANLAEDA